jgi:hypothetical protein
MFPCHLLATGMRWSLCWGRGLVLFCCIRGGIAEFFFVMGVRGDAISKGVMHYHKRVTQPSYREVSGRFKEKDSFRKSRRYRDGEIVVLKVMLRFCLVDIRSSAIYLANAPSQLFWEREVRQAQGKSRNLYRFAYVNLYILQIHWSDFIYVNSYNLRIHIIWITFSSIVHKGYFHGHDTLPFHGKTHSAIDKQTEKWI